MSGRLTESGSVAEVLFVMGDPPWPTRSGGDLRTAALHRALSSFALVRTLLFPVRRSIDEAATPAPWSAHPVGMPSTVAGRGGLRARSIVAGEHPFVARLRTRGAAGVLRAAIERHRPMAVVMVFPAIAGPVLAAASGRVLIVDLGELRGPLAADVLRNGRPGARLRAAGDLLVARRMEDRVARHATETWFATERDALAFRARPGRPAARFVPNVVDVDTYAHHRTAPRIAGTFTFVGALDYPPNVDAAMRLARAVLPIVRQSAPDAVLRIVGRRPSDAVRALAGLPGVQLLADVPDAVAAMAEAPPLVVALRTGAGTKLKVLEAAAAGVPIVTTRVGLEGLEFVPERECLVADDDEGLAAAILRVWREPGLAGRLADGALATVGARYGMGALVGSVAQAIEAARTRGDA